MADAETHPRIATKRLAAAVSIESDIKPRPLSVSQNLALVRLVDGWSARQHASEHGYGTVYGMRVHCRSADGRSSEYMSLKTFHALVKREYAEAHNAGRQRWWTVTDAGRAVTGADK